MSALPDPENSYSVVVPVYNEADNVLPLLAEITAALEPEGVAYEVIYVDDGSGDETPERLKEARAKFSHLRVLRLRENCGQSTAIWAGVRSARAKWIVTLDGDGQNDPADIPRLIAAARQDAGSAGPPLVAGIRRRRRDSWLRRISSRIANAVRSRILDDRTPDTGCSLKLFEREVFLQLPFFDHMHRFLPALFRRDGRDVILVEVNHRPRQRGASSYGVGNRLWVGMADLLGVLWLQRRARHPVIEYEE